VTRPAATGLAHSVQVRLKNAATQAGRPFSELLELYAVERFLHRLGRSRHRERFVLKGARCSCANGSAWMHDPPAMSIC